MEGSEIRYLGEMQRLQPQPGDVFVLSMGVPVNHDQHKYLMDYWRSVMGDAKLLVLESGMKLGVVSETA